MVCKNGLKVKALHKLLEIHVHSTAISYHPRQWIKKQDYGSVWTWSASISSSTRSMCNRFTNMLQSLMGSCSVLFDPSGSFKGPLAGDFLSLLEAKADLATTNVFLFKDTPTIFTRPLLDKLLPGLASIHWHLLWSDQQLYYSLHHFQ